MELFVVRNSSGEVIRSGFNNKMAAKTARTELHTKDGIDEASINSESELKYFVSRGKDHVKTKKK